MALHKTEYDPPSPREMAAQSRKLIRPQDQYGLADNGKTCKTCRYLVCRSQSAKWYKCQKWRMSMSVATDIRLKWPACKLYEPEDQI